jgi:5-methylcytosine-specific restriction endonuclease McrA
VTQRICSVEGCERTYWARDMCSSHYGTWHKRTFGRNRQAEYFTITCIVCGSEHQASRAESKFCSAACKGRHYSETMRTRCKLPVDHPVILLIAAAKAEQAEARRLAKQPTFAWRTARECPGCACWFTPLYTPNALCCSHRCAKRMARQRRRAREVGARGEFTWAEFMRIARKFNFCCAYCGGKPERLDPDHVVPLSRGGSNTPSNLLPTCAACNSSKGAMTLTEWAAWLESRGMPPRRTTWSGGDLRYTHLTEALLSVA